MDDPGSQSPSVSTPSDVPGDEGGRVGDGLVVIASEGVPDQNWAAFNAYLGISFSRNTYFSKARVHQYVAWAATRVGRLLILPADHLEAYNFQVLKELPFDVALKKTLAKGRELIRAYERAIPPELTSRVEVALASTLLAEPACAAILEVVRGAAAQPGAFRDDVRSAVIASVSGTRSPRSEAGQARRRRVEAGLDVLQNYLVEEIAIILYLVRRAVPPYELAIFPYRPQAVIPRLFEGKYGPPFSAITGGQPFRFVQLAPARPPTS